MKRPFFPVGISFLTAMAVSFSFGVFGGVGMLLLLLPLALVLRGESRRALGLVLAAVAIAGLLFQGHLWLRFEPAARLDGQTLLFTGTVLEREKAGRGERYQLKGSFPQVEGLGETAIQLTSFSSWDLLPGEEVEALVELSALSFDTAWGRSAISRGVYLAAEPVKEPKLVPTLSHPVEGRLAWYRWELGQRISSAVGGREGALCTGMALGDGGLLSREDSRAMRGAGLSHLLAVSGFHLVVLTGLLRQLLNKFRVKKRWKIPLLLALTWGYAALLGFPVSIRRAAVVFTLSLLAEAVDRQADGLTSLGVAALLIGMIDPFSAGSLSVQMTFLSSLGILLWTGPVVRFLEGRVLFFLGPRLPRVRWAVEAFALSLCAGLALSPLLAYHFGVVALYGPLAAVFTALLVPLALGATAALALLPMAEPLAAPLARFAAAGILQVAHGVSSLPGAVWPAGDGAVPLVFAFAVALLMFLALAEAEGKTVRLAALGLAALLFGVLSVEQILSAGTIRQVGMEGWDGLALLRQGRAVVVGSPGGASSGERLCDLLDRYGVEGLDLLVLPRKAEGAGLDLLLEEHPAACIVAAGSEEYREGLAGEAQVIPYGPMEIRLLGEGRLFLLPGGEVRVEREK